MAKPYEKLGVVILGAGASARMGRPKLLLPWNSTTVIGQLILQWRELGVGQVAVVMRENDAKLVEELKRLDVESSRGVSTPQHLNISTDRIINPQPERGMFSSVICAANWNGWSKNTSRWAMVLGDQPHLQTETLRALLEFSAQNTEAICQPSLGGKEKHPVILPPQAFVELKISTATTLKEFLKLTGCLRVQCPVNDPGLSLDLDTPEDYKRLTVSR